MAYANTNHGSNESGDCFVVPPRNDRYYVGYIPSRFLRDDNQPPKLTVIARALFATEAISAVRNTHAPHFLFSQNLKKSLQERKIKLKVTSLLNIFILEYETFFNSY